MTDWTALASAIGSVTTLAGTLGGYWFAARNEESRDRRAAEREAASRRAALAERLEEDRHTFQRDTLLALQDLLLQLVRMRALVTAQDIKTLKSHGKLYLLPEELGGNEHRQVVASIQRLRARVLDTELRTAISDFVGLCTQDSTELNGAEPSEAIGELRQRDTLVANGYVTIAERLGVHIRKELDRRTLVNEPEVGSPGLSR